MSLLRKGAITTSRRIGPVCRGPISLVNQCYFAGGAELAYAIYAVHPTSEVKRSACGHSFSLPSERLLTEVRFLLTRYDFPDGHLVARLYAGKDDGTGKIIPIDDPPDSGILAQSKPIEMSSILRLASEWISFTFSSGQRCRMKAGVIYVAQVVALDATILDTSNYIFADTYNPGRCVGNGSLFQIGAWVGTDNEIALRVYGCPSL